MATKDKSTESVYRVTEVIGTSAQSWEDAAKTAVETAAGTLRDLRVAEVVKMDVKIEDGKVTEYPNSVTVVLQVRRLVRARKESERANKRRSSPSWWTVKFRDFITSLRSRAIRSRTSIFMSEFSVCVSSSAR